MTKAFMLRIARILVMLVVVLQVAALHGAEVRHDDVIYLHDWKHPLLHLKALHRTPLMSSRDSRRMIAYVAQGQSVKVIGWGDNQHYVVASLTTGPARGWVEADTLEPPPAELLAKLRERREKAQAHRDLIERHEVVIGMTRVEVRASLGKPDRTARVRAKLGDEEQWFYITYKYLPHYTQKRNEAGQLRQIVSYRRVPASHRIVTFREDEVIGISGDQAEEARLPIEAGTTTSP